MIPLGDASRRPLHFPLVTMLIIVANAFVFVLELIGGDAFITRWSLVPAAIVAGRSWVTILTSMFMHEGWLHILGNMLFFWVFGPEIEDVMGSGRYLVFYLLGAIAAVMGAFLITYPRDQIRTILLIGWFVRITAVPALVLVGIWFLTQLFSEVGSVVAVQTGGGVAYMAHIGGFLFGAVLGRFFETRERRAEEGLQ
jgi:membrane associated rhomboid family serine protease